MGKASENMKLPKDMFAVLPKDPDEQLEVAQQITQIAVSGRVAKLEAETSSLRQKVVEKDSVINNLQARVVGAETKLAETTIKLNVALENQAKSIEDKIVLAGQVNKLIFQVSKLDDFKKALIQNLEASTKCGDDNTGDKNQASSLGSSSASSRATPCNSLPASPMSKSTTPPTPSKRKQQGQFSCMMLEEPSSKFFSKSNVAPQDGLSSKQSLLGLLTPFSPLDSPRPPVKSPRIDNKQLFRQVRGRFSYEEFSEFLTNVKKLNAHRQAKELNARQMALFHPIIFSCNTHAPPYRGEWVFAMPS